MSTACATAGRCRSGATGPTRLRRTGCCGSTRASADRGDLPGERVASGGALHELVQDVVARSGGVEGRDRGGGTDEAARAAAGWLRRGRAAVIGSGSIDHAGQVYARRPVVAMWHGVDCRSRDCASSATLGACQQRVIRASSTGPGVAGFGGGVRRRDPRGARARLLVVPLVAARCGLVAGPQRRRVARSFRAVRPAVRSSSVRPGNGVRGRVDGSPGGLHAFGSAAMAGARRIAVRRCARAHAARRLAAATAGRGWGRLMRLGPDRSTS